MTLTYKGYKIIKKKFKKKNLKTLFWGKNKDTLIQKKQEGEREREREREYTDRRASRWEHFGGSIDKVDHEFFRRFSLLQNVV